MTLVVVLPSDSLGVSLSSNKVVVLMGGESTEHQVSLRSGLTVTKNLAKTQWQPVPVIVGRDGRFAFPKLETFDLNQVDSLPYVELGAATSKIAALEPACVFLALHGLYGEDGRFQALCDLMRLPYVGADVIGSAVAMDKWLAKAVYNTHNIPTPDAVLLALDDLDPDGLWQDRVIDEIGLPCVVKAPRQGSSLGVYIVRQQAKLSDAVKEVFKLGDRVMIEAFCPGRELSVSVLEDPTTGRPKALAPIEIVVKKREFFDYEAKYDAAETDEICPAPIDEQQTKAVSRLAEAAHRALMLSGFSRSDFMLTASGELMTLETNTIPGLTDVSLFPKAAAVAGLSFPELVDGLVRQAIRIGRRG